MKTFNKTSLPEQINHNGKIYKRDTNLSLININSSLNSYLKTCDINGLNVVQCNVLSAKLKGKTDLYGKPYQPTTWFFTAKK